MQGNEHSQFCTKSFPVLRDCVKKMMEYGHFLKSPVLDSYDTEETFMKWVEPVTKPNHSLASVANDTLNKSFDNTLIDTIFVLFVCLFGS